MQNRYHRRSSLSRRELLQIEASRIPSRDLRTPESPKRPNINVSIDQEFITMAIVGIVIVGYGILITLLIGPLYGIIVTIIFFSRARRES